MAFSHLRSRVAVLAGVALVLTACSLIVNKDKDQCSTDGDCAPTGACMDGVCVVAAGGGLDGSSEGSMNGDGSMLGPDGCTPKVPVSQNDFLNETCTTASCVPFDNCARVGLCPGDSGLPELIAPPDGGF